MYLLGMKTTLNLDDRLLVKAKSIAAEQKTSLTKIIEEGIELRLRSAIADRVPTELPVFNGGSGLHEGLSGLSSRELLDAAD